jgi:hypothetical protein
MATDVRTDQVDGSFLELEARVVKAISSDFMLDQPSRRNGGGPFRRALVHNEHDGLTINFGGDYPGGVTLNGLNTLEVHGDITFGMPGVRVDVPGTVMVPSSLRETIIDLQSQISLLVARVKALGG